MIDSKIAKIDDDELKKFLGKEVTIYTSLEGENPGGSIKDHMVVGHLNMLKASGKLSKHSVICEASAGSTAKSLAYYCNRLELKCTLFVPDTLPEEELDKLFSLRADVRAVPADIGFQLFNEFCTYDNVISFNQLYDKTKREHYSNLGNLISSTCGQIDAIVGTVGTSHSLVGVSMGLSAGTKVISAEPDQFEVAGIRNIAKTRYGDQDPCNLATFSRRILVTRDTVYGEKSLSTSLGKIHFGDSFRVALGAVKTLINTERINKLFVVGANCKRLF